MSNQHLESFIPLDKLFIGVLKHDHSILKNIYKIPNSLLLGSLMMGISIIFDFLNIRGFTFRVPVLTENQELSLFYVPIQILHLLFVAWILQAYFEYRKMQIPLSHIFTIMGFAHIWTIISSLIFLLINSLWESQGNLSGSSFGMFVFLSNLVLFLFIFAYLKTIYKSFFEGDTLILDLANMIVIGILYVVGGIIISSIVSFIPF